MVKIEISNRSFILIALLFVIIIGGGLVIAYNSAGNPAVFGHSLNEVAMPSCTTGQVLVKTASGWDCGSIPSSTSFTLSSYNNYGKTSVTDQNIGAHKYCALADTSFGTSNCGCWLYLSGTNWIFRTSANPCNCAATCFD